MKILLASIILMLSCLCMYAQCESSSLVSYIEYLDSVSFSETSNSSGDNGGYADFTDISHFQSKQDSVVMQLQAGYEKRSFSVVAAVYVDLDKNGQFEDGELQFLSLPFSGTTRASFLLPDWISPGATSLRIVLVRAKDVETISPCGSYEFGETEDYSIEIAEDSETCLAPTGIAVSSPNFYTLDFNCEVNSEAEAYIFFVYSTEGQLVLSAESSIPTVSIYDPRLKNCETYQVSARTRCGSSLLSEATEPETVALHCGECSVEINVENYNGSSSYTLDFTANMEGQIESILWTEGEQELGNSESIPVNAESQTTVCVEVSTDQGCVATDCASFGLYFFPGPCAAPTILDVESLAPQSITAEFEELLYSTDVFIRDLLGNDITQTYASDDAMMLEDMALRNCDAYLVSVTTICSTIYFNYSLESHPEIVHMHCGGCDVAISQEQLSATEHQFYIDALAPSGIQEYTWTVNGQAVSTENSPILQVGIGEEVCLNLSPIDGQVCSNCMEVEEACQQPIIGLVEDAGYEQIRLVAATQSGMENAVFQEHFDWVLSDGAGIEVASGNGSAGNSFLSVGELETCSPYTLFIYKDCSADSVYTDLSAPSEAYPFYTDCPEGQCGQVSQMEVSSDRPFSLSVSWNTVPEAFAYNVQVLDPNSQELVYEQATMRTDIEMHSVLLSACDSFMINVQSVCRFGSITDVADLGSIEMACPTTVEDCSASALYSVSEHIASVSIEQMQVQSGNNGGYYRHLEETASLQSGEVFSLQAVPGFSADSSEVIFSIYIDYDQDGLFDDSELVQIGEPSAAAFEGEIELPAGLDQRVTQMRLMMIRADEMQDFVPCASPALGEIEDYYIEINSSCQAVVEVEQQENYLAITALTTTHTADINYGLLNMSGESAVFNGATNLNPPIDEYSLICLSTDAEDCQDEYCLYYPPTYCERARQLNGSSSAAYEISLTCDPVQGAEQYRWNVRSYEREYAVQIESEDAFVSFTDTGFELCELLVFSVETVCGPDQVALSSAEMIFWMDCAECQAGFLVDEEADNQFTLSSVSTADSEIVAYNWTLDGQSWATSDQVSGQFETAQEVCLSITGQNQCTSTYCELIGPAPALCPGLSEITLSSEAQEQISLQWVGQATENVQVSVFDGDEQLVLQTSLAPDGPNDLVLESPLLEACATYAVQIQNECDDAISSEPLAAALVQINCENCDLPAEIAATDISETSFTLNWSTPVSGPEYYEYHLTLLSDTIASGLVAQSPLAFGDLSPCTEYLFSIESPCGPSSPVQSLAFNTDCPTELEAPDPKAFELYPNPGSGLINIRFAASTEDRQIRLNNALGQRVFEQAIASGAEAAEFSLSLAPGIYLCQLYEASRLISVERILVLR